MLLWYLFIDSNLYHTHHTHRSGSYDRQIGLLLPQHSLPQIHSPMPPLPYQHNCFPLGIWHVFSMTAVSLWISLSLSAFIQPCSILKRAGGVSRMQQPREEPDTHLWCFVARYSWVQSSATAELIPGVDRQLESAFAGGSKWLWNAPRSSSAGRRHQCNSQHDKTLCKKA